MLKRLMLAGAAICLAPSCLWAQTYRDANGTVISSFVPLIGCVAGARCTGPISTVNPLPVLVTGGGGTGSGGTVSTVASNPTSVYSGQQTCNITAAALPAQALVNGVVVKALKTNTATVYLGGSSVSTATGYPLVAGESISYAVANLNAVNLICQNATDIVAITGN